MERRTIVLGGAHAYQLPSSLIDLVPRTRLDGAAWKVFSWMLWQAHRGDLWQSAGDEHVANLHRFPANDTNGPTD